MIHLAVACVMTFCSGVGRAASDASVGRSEWIYGTSTCEACRLEIDPVPGHPEMDSRQVREFLRQLEIQKARLMAMYGVSGQDYNLLAKMSVGILGRESLFFTSKRYWLKEEFPQMISVLKVVSSVIRTYLKGQNRTLTDSSRGPTQIKRVPSRIRAAYGFGESDLHVPENAAVATMGFLIESLQELKRRLKMGQLSYINESNYEDYLPYLYFGSRSRLFKSIPDPKRNAYVNAMKRYESWVILYELDPRVTEVRPQN